MTLDNYLLIAATCILATLKPDSRLKIRNSLLYELKACSGFNLRPIISMYYLVLMAVTMKTSISWNVKPCSLTKFTNVFEEHHEISTETT